jgi:hypothetical protein
MKKITRAFIVMFVMGILFSNQGYSQAKLESNDLVNITLTKNGISYRLTSGTEKVWITPVNNLVRMVTFKIDETNPILDLADPYAAFLGAGYTVTVNGEPVRLIGVVVITKSGNVKLMYTMNGSGCVFSPGRF